ncbi:MAG: hypothetical protein E7586_00420 [Ruminococcaceae bacterium]|nr:hypothetical protein [Oscillospiraceae bacterium]
MRKIIYILIQFTWGFLQTLFGLVVFLTHVKDKHYFYHGAIITEWSGKSSVSLGMFVFITKEPFFYEKLKDEYSADELWKRLLVHEYGHTIQSLILGPLYLPFIGIPSTIWGFSPSLNGRRKIKQISYFSFFTEKWANHLGEKFTQEKSMENLVID